MLYCNFKNSNIKFVLEAKVKNGTFWNTANLSVCHYSVAININFNNETEVQDTTSCRNANSRRSRASNTFVDKILLINSQI